MEQRLSVSQITRFVRTLLENNAVLRRVVIEGELANFKRQSSGHLYYYLKDSDSRISCVQFRTNAQSLSFIPKDGMTVVVHGSLSVYEKGGQYQINVKRMDPLGIGAFYQAFEELKERLSAKGWFDATSKSPLPIQIQRVGVVTSASGAAIHDIISVITRRNPSIKIVLKPAQVQGIEAPEQIAEAIDTFCELENVDVLIVGRGGGSVEDLQAFNAECVAEAIHFSSIPIISAVGHETDFTIADFVADLRAPTPSAAAELVANDQRAIKQSLRDYGLRFYRAIIDDLTVRQHYLKQLRQRINVQSPVRMVEQNQLTLDWQQQRLLMAIETQLNTYTQHVATYRKSFSLMNPDALLKKGYSIVYNEKGHIIRKCDDVNLGDRLKLKLVDGSIDVRVEKENNHGRD